MHIPHIYRSMVVALALIIAPVAALADDAPTAKVTMSETQVGFLLTGDWGHGTLTYQGKDHMFHMGGGKIGGIGASKMKIQGTVYYLNNLDDFEGVYFKADAALTIAKGKGGSWLKNDNGVVLHLGADSEGLALGLGVGGLKVSF